MVRVCVHANLCCVEIYYNNNFMNGYSPYHRYTVIPFRLALLLPRKMIALFKMVKL